MSILGSLLAADNELRLSRAASDAISRGQAKARTPDQSTTRFAEGSSIGDSDQRDGVKRDMVDEVKMQRRRDQAKGSKWSVGTAELERVGVIAQKDVGDG